MKPALICASRCVAAALLLIGLSTQVSAAPVGMDLSLVAGHATTDTVHKLGVVAGWMRPDPLWQGSRWQLALRHEVELSFWRAPRGQDVVEFGYSPVLRLQRPSAQGNLFFVEASIGVRGLSHTRVSADRDMGTHYQFSDVLGAGWQWGPDGRSTLGVRFQHLSNGGIERPNPGINFGQVYYRHRF